VSKRRQSALCLIAAFFVLPSRFIAQPPPKLPDAPEKAVFIKTCSGCHSPEAVLGRLDTPKNWKRTVDHMIARGAKGTPEDFDQVIRYLDANFTWTAGQVKFPDGPGKAAFLAACSGCHAPDVVVGRDGREGTHSQWMGTIDRMIARGAKGTDEQFDQIADYLTTNFGYIPVPSNLPDGPGKELVERACGPCHGVSLFNGRHESRDAWNRTIDNMIRRGAKVTPEEFDQLSDYFVQNFGLAGEK
jgi:mono/diheme cytochrome c family protein